MSQKSWYKCNEMIKEIIYNKKTCKAFEGLEYYTLKVSDKQWYEQSRYDESFYLKITIILENPPSNIF